MTEYEMRKKYVEMAESFLNYNEANGSFRTIIDLYNAISPLPGGYRMSYNDPWCAAFVSAVAHICGFTGFIFPECSCDRMIKLYKSAGRWQENDAYVPQPGDIIMYDWEDNGVGDNTGSADHVGIVADINGQQIKIIEGNINDMVAYRFMMVNGKNIRGYCLPDYAGHSANAAAPAAQPTASRSVLKLGMQGEDVRELQEKLIRLGYFCGSDGADGDFGNNTLAAVIKYQKQKGLEADGEVGPLTMASIDNNVGAFSGAPVAPAASGKNDEEIIWDYLMSKFQNAFAVAGIMGNLFAESSLNPKNLQNTSEKSLGYTDEGYTNAVDNRMYTNFVYDSAGYGIAQWTFWSRKKGLLDYARSKGASIGDLQMQLEYMYKEIETDYSAMLKTLLNAKSVREASDLFVVKYEQPADQGQKQKEKRAGYGEGYYDKYHDHKPAETVNVASHAHVEIESGYSPKIGDTVRFIGTKHYMSYNGLLGLSCKSGTARITSIVAGTKHPYHLVKVADGGSNVYGWVNREDIEEM